MSTPIRTHEADGAISAYGTARSTVEGTPLAPAELRNIDAYWRASLYLCLGMLYLKANPLLQEPLTLEHIKPRLLGHWGSDAGQAFTYIHFNRLIKYDLNAIYISGPGREQAAAVPGVSPGTYSEIYLKERRRRGMQRFFKQFSSWRHRQPHMSAGQYPRGRRAGLQLACLRHDYDNPDLITLVMVGDGGPKPAPGHQLAQQQVSQPDQRRSSTAGPAPQRLQDQQPDHSGPDQPRRAERAVCRLRIHPVFCRRQ
jgi:xylulose-5-phosphate/fructose-6-phosphate phosphoketolase